MARSNNREWFYLPKSIVWEIFLVQLKQVVKKYKFRLHAFLLMSNHYHLIASASEKYNLGIVMQDLQKSVSRTINKKSGRSNHVFGGPYKASLIRNENYYYNVYKYLYRNPLEANIVSNIADYSYSSLFHSHGLEVQRPENGIDALIPYANLFKWIDEPFEESLYSSINKGLRRTEFKYISRKY